MYSWKVRWDLKIASGIVFFSHDSFKLHEFSPQKKSNTSANKIVWTWFLRPPKTVKHIQLFLHVGEKFWRNPCEKLPKTNDRTLKNDDFQKGSLFAVCSIFRVQPLSFEGTFFHENLWGNFCLFCYFASKSWCFTRLNGPLGCFIWGRWTQGIFSP